MLQTTEHRYIVADDEILRGEPIIEGSLTPVRAIVETWCFGVPPEEIPIHLPHLTLAQVFDDLSYYSDYRDQLHDYIERNRVPDHMIDSVMES